ncbi:MAG: glycosyltransferase [Flavobacteriia bacterium]|nr:glycosyltransferase [Flavobacteriia bacterium]
MKIAFLSTFYPFRGGIAQFNALLFREFEKKNQVKAFTFKRQYPNFLFPGETQFVTENDPADIIPSERVLDTINPFSFIKSAKKIKKFAPDILITKYWMTFFGPSLGFVCKSLNKNTKRISILDNVIPHEKRFFDGICNRYFLKNNDGFIVMSDVVLKDLLSLKPNAKYLRINHPVYNHFPEKINPNLAKEKLNLNNNLKTILFFGFIRDYKGLDLLIEAFNYLDEGYQLIIAGEVYGSFEKYAKLIQQSKAKDRIHVFNQYIGDEDVSLYFSAADVCVLPYKSATQSGITSISNHYNLPQIVTNVGGLKESIQENITGLVVENVDSQNISLSIKKYFDQDLYSIFSKNIDLEKKENSWENFANKIIDFSQTL